MTVKNRLKCIGKLIFNAGLIFLQWMKQVRSIYTLLLVAVFFVPAAGFYYNRHSCLTSGEVHLVICGDYDCCTSADQLAGTHSETCCSPDLSKPSGTCCGTLSGMDTPTSGECSLASPLNACCINEIQFIKSDDDYTPPGKTEIPQVKMLVIASIPSPDMPAATHDAVEEYANSPPFALSSIDILHKHSVLLI